MGKVQCKLYNDTKYTVYIEDYDGNRYLSPGETQTNWLLTGARYYINMTMIFPDHKSEPIRLYNSDYNDQTHRISTFFQDDIRREEEAARRRREEEAARRRREEEAARRRREEAARKRREQEEREAARRQREIQRRQQEAAKRHREEVARRLRVEQERKRREEEERRHREEIERRHREEEERKRREEIERRRREEEERRRREEIERRRREEEERRRREEIERRRREEEERRRREEIERRRREEEERRRREEIERRRREEKERRRREEIERMRREEEERRRREEIERRRREEEERKRREEEERKHREEEERKRREEIERMRREEEERKRREEEERKRREEERKRREEKERVENERKHREEVERKRREEIERRRREEEERMRREEERKHREEEERKRKEEERKRREEEERVENERKHREEVERKRTEEIERRRREAEERKHREEEERKHRQEEERKHREEEERKRREEERKRREEERVENERKHREEMERKRREEIERRHREEEERKRREEERKRREEEEREENERRHRKEEERRLREDEERKLREKEEREEQKRKQSEEQKQKQVEWKNFRQKLTKAEEVRRKNAKIMAVKSLSEAENIQYNAEVKREAEYQKFTEEERRQKRKCIEDERNLNDFRSFSTKVKCSLHEYEDRLNRNEEIHKSQFQNWSTPMKTSSNTVTFREGYYSPEIRVTRTTFERHLESELNSDEDDDSWEEDSSSDDMEVLKQVLTTETSDYMNREWLTEVQTYCLFHFSQERGFNETDLEILLYTLSSTTSSLSDHDFFKLTKALASLCIVSENSKSEILQTYFLRGLLCICGITHGYLRNACVSTIVVEDEDFLQMVPAFTEASFQCFVSLISPSTSLNPDQLSWFIHYIQAHQLPLDLVKYAITNENHDPLLTLENYVQRKSNKCLEELVMELSLSNTSLPADILVTIVNCLSSQDLECMQVPSFSEGREALLKIGNKASQDSDLILAMHFLSNTLEESIGYRPRLTQLLSLCILLLSNQLQINRLLEVLTGEGKSCIIAMFAAALGLQGRKVDIVTSSPVLAKRDAANWAKFYQRFGLTVAHNTDTVELLASVQSKADMERGGVYGCDIVYGTVSSFSADILREEFEMRAVRSGRGFQSVIIDEVDMLMMDEGVQFTYLSHRLALLRHIEPVIALVWSAVQQHSPLVTEDGDVLFAEVPKYFLSVILDGIDMSNYPEVEDEVYKVHNLSDPEKKMALLSLFDNINTSRASSVKVYTLNEDGTLHLTSECVYDEENMSVLVSDNGRVQQLYTQEKLSEGVRGIVLSQCDITTKDILHTTDGAVYVVGSPSVFDKVHFGLNSTCQRALYMLLQKSLALNKINKVLQSVDTKERMIALEDINTQDMLLFIEKLNEHQSAFSVVAYTLNGSGKLRQATRSTPDHHNPITFLVKDKGILHPLHTLDDANANQDEILYTPNGVTFSRGTADFMENVMYPILLLHLLIKNGIVQDKVEKVLHADDETSKKKAIESFCIDDMLTILEFMEKQLRCGVRAYTSASNNTLKTLQQPTVESEYIFSVLILEEGKMCRLDENVEETLEGSEFCHRQTDYFQNVICTAMDSSKLFHLLTEEFCGSKVVKSTKQTIASQDVLKALSCWMEYLPFKLVIYTIDATEQLSTCKQDENTIPVLLLENGSLCRLQTKEKLAVPSSLKDFVASQLPTYIESAFTAHLMTENREYLVSKEGKISRILPIDFQNSGVIEANKRWGGGLQQMLEMKHQLQISPMSVITNFLSHVGFFRRYKEGTLFGLSGTIGSESDFEVLEKLYKLHTCRIPTFRQRLLYEREPVFVEGERNDWLNEIHCILKNVTGPKPNIPGAAALVLCEDIRTAKEICGYIHKNGQKAIPYTGNDVEPFNEDDERKPGDIIVATNLAGRGTDIKLSKEVNNSGGLFCLMTFLPRNRRVELQAFGRTARKGNPGSVQFVLSALTSSTEHLEILNAMRDAREEAESARLKHMVEKDVEEVLLREELFQKHCQFLKDLHGELEKRKDRQMIIDAINENWGLWLQTKHQAFVLQRRDHLLNDLSAAHRRWKPSGHDAASYLVPFPPECNFLHLVKFGNKCVFELGGKRINKKGACEAHHYFERATEMESNFTMVAYYNLACCVLKVCDKGYIDKSLDYLTKAKTLLQVYKDEVTTISQCTTVNARIHVEHEDSQFLEQTEIRMQVLQYFEKQIDETTEKLKELKEKGEDAEVVPTSILDFIPKADIMTNEELYGLKLLGLETAFSVEKKPTFSWAALGVFILGVAQIVAGACLVVLSTGTMSSFGMGLISEGVSDCIDGVVGMVTNEFDLKDWAISKACSIALSVACGGVGKFIQKGGKAAIKGLKAAKKVGTAAKAANEVSHDVRLGTAVAKAASEVAQDVKLMGKVAKGSFGSSLKSGMKNAGKLVAKEFISQGVMYGLNKVENLAIEEILMMIGRRIKCDVKKPLEVSFTTNRENDLGQFVERQLVVCSKYPKSVQETEVRKFFESVADEAIASLQRESDSGTFKEISERFRDQILPQLSQHLKGKAAKAVAVAVELTFVKESINRTVEHLSSLTQHYQPEMVKVCSKVCMPEADYSQVTDDSTRLRKDLAELAADKFGEAVVAVLKENLTWMLSRALSKTVNRKVSEHLNKGLDIKRTKDEIKSLNKANYIAYMPPQRVRHVDENAWKKMEKNCTEHAVKIRNPDTPATLTELKVCVETLKCKVAIEDRNGKRIRSLESHSHSSHEERTKITLIHTPPDKHPPTGHYDVKIGDKIVPVESHGNSCMFEALAVGLKREGHLTHDAQSLRNLVSDEISKHPGKWHDHFERKEQLERMKNGKLHLLEGGAAIRGKQKAGQSKKPGKVRTDDKARKPQNPIKPGAAIQVKQKAGKSKKTGKVGRTIDKAKRSIKPGAAVQVKQKAGKSNKTGKVRRTVDKAKHSKKRIKPGAAVQVKQKAGKSNKTGKVRRTIDKAKRTINKATAICNETSEPYARVMLDDTCECITYIQKNGLEVTSFTEYDRKPVGKTRPRNFTSIPNVQEMTFVENNINMKGTCVTASKCNFDRNEGRCKHTQPSFKQLSYTECSRPRDGSAPVSFHLIPSEAGANAGTSFGNSVVASEHYNKKERELCSEIKKYVNEYYKEKVNDKNKGDFTCEVTVEFENLIPPGGIEKFIRERNAKMPLQIDESCATKLEERFKRIGEIATEGLEASDVRQVQRVKSLVYVVTLPGCPPKKFQDLGRDTELYVHSELNDKNFNNKDLNYATASRKKMVTGTVPAL